MRMKNRERLEKFIEEHGLKDAGLLYAEGFDDAILGIGQKFNDYSVVYDYNKCIEILEKQGMTYEEAIEYFDFNVTGAYVGKNTPIFVYGREYFLS